MPPLGPVFVVDSLATFHGARAESLVVLQEPGEIPGGFRAVYQDPGGAAIYVMDQSRDSSIS